MNSEQQTHLEVKIRICKSKVGERFHYFTAGVFEILQVPRPTNNDTRERERGPVHQQYKGVKNCSQFRENHLKISLILFLKKSMDDRSN